MSHRDPMKEQEMVLIRKWSWYKIWSWTRYGPGHLLDLIITDQSIVGSRSVLEPSEVVLYLDDEIFLINIWYIYTDTLKFNKTEKHIDIWLNQFIAWSTKLRNKKWWEFTVKYQTSFYSTKIEYSSYVYKRFILNVTKKYSAEIIPRGKHWVYFYSTSEILKYFLWMSKDTQND